MKPLPPDHDEFVAWHQEHRQIAWHIFNEYLAQSPWDIRPVGEEQEGDKAPTRIRREFAKWLAQRFPKERKLRDWTKRGMHHELKPRKFYLKEQKHA